MDNIYIPIPTRTQSWWDQVSPRAEEMPDFLRAYMGKGMQFRTPKHRWEDLWRLKRGEVNDILGIRRARSISNRVKGPKYQRGVLSPIGFWKDPPAGGTEPDLSDICHDVTGANPQRIHIAYDSDGEIWWAVGGTVGSIVYADLSPLTTASNCDANDHTSEWWPDNPETNEGLNWDIRITNITSAFTAIFPTGGSPLNRLEDEWYLLDDVSNDIADGTNNGSIRVQVSGKSSGTHDGIGDVEIRATGSGSAVASHEVNLQAIGTG